MMMGEGHMEQEHEREIAEIISGMKCPKDFKCCKSGFENLCKAEDIGMASFLLCLEEDPEWCKFSLRYGSAYLCDCPVRVYITKELNH
jgi:hypothetical protein